MAGWITTSAVSLISTLALLGWIFDIQRFKSILPDWTAMMFNTALCLLISGSTLAFLYLSRSLYRRRLAAIPALLIFTTGAATLAEYLLGRDLGIDQFLWPAGEGEPFPGRMSPLTAAGFILAGATFLSAAFRRPGGVLTGGVLLLLASLVPIAGYAYEVSSLYGSEGYTQMAFHTAVSFMFLGIGFLGLNPEQTPLRILSSDSAGGMTARRLLLVIPPVIFILGWLCVNMVRSGRFEDIVTPLALFTVVSMSFTIGLVGWHALFLHKVDVERQQGLAEIRTLNEDLERKVEERTAELKLALEQVRRLEGMLPICAWCRKVRDDEAGQWEPLEDYLTSHTDARITHSICPECFKNAVPAS